VSVTSQPQEFILKKVRQALLEGLQHSSHILQQSPLSDENVHAVRRGLKRTRASLRLLREALGMAEYRRLNRAVRDAARPLSTMRDGKVLLQTLDTVIAKADKAPSIPSYAELRRSLQQEARLYRKNLTAQDIAAIRHHLTAVEQSLQGLSDTRLDRVDISAAIKRSHKKTRRASKAAKRESSDENLHEWRKQVKYERGQLELLQPLKSKRIDSSVQQAHKLSDCLSDDHDFAVLREKILAQFTVADTDNTDVDVLLKVLKPMRAKLQKKAHRLGKALHNSKLSKKIGKALNGAYQNQSGESDK